MFIFVCISVTANQNGCMRGQHFACVLPLRRCPMLLIYYDIYDLLSCPQKFTTSTAFTILYCLNFLLAKSVLEVVLLGARTSLRVCPTVLKSAR